MVEQMNLADLPNEVLTRVLSNITGQGHLANIALVSKQFKDLIDLQLYRDISLDVHCSAKELHDEVLNHEYAHTTMPSFVRFDRLMNKFSVRPDLARQLHTLSLRVRCRLWYKPFAADSRLLNLLPELRVLSLSPPSMHSSVLSKDSTITSLRLDFGQVTDQYDRDAYSGGTFIDRVPMQIIAGHLSSPKLRRVQVEKVLLRRISDEARYLPPDSSSVDDLRLLECCGRMGYRTVAGFLCSIKLLKRFVFECSSQPNNPARHRAGIASFQRAFTRHQGTIEELALATNEGRSRIVWTMGPFTQWTSLKLLAIPDYMISGVISGTQKLHEILPPLLEELQIDHSWSPDLIRATDVRDMQLLAANKEFYLPRLTRVIWWHQDIFCTPQPSKDTTDENLPVLMEIFLLLEQVGVKFEWNNEVLFRNTPFGKRLYKWKE